MPPISALIVDDEAPARENLKMMLESFCPEVNVIAMASSVDEAYNSIVSLQPEVVFLDIRMPSGSEGFDLLQKFEKKDFQVIFVTAFKEYAIDAFKANAINYLLKPIDIDDLQNAVEQLVKTKEAWSQDESLVEKNSISLDRIAQNLIAGSPQKITVNHASGIKIFETNKIEYLEGKGNCTEIHFLDGTKYLDTRTLKVYEELLPSQFYRVHKSYVVNINEVKEYISDQGNFARTSSKKNIPVAKARLKDFLQKIRNI